MSVDSPAIKIKSNAPYGPVRQGFELDLGRGYVVLLGPNSAGKSIILQCIFKELYSSYTPAEKDSVCLILSDRVFVSPTTKAPTTFHEYNNSLFGKIETGPRNYQAQSINNHEALYSLLLDTSDLLKQVDEANRYLARLGFDPLILKKGQIAHVQHVPITSHGSGLRSILPIIAALTCPDIKTLLIDEPEQTLEARTQRVLKELLVEAVEGGKTAILATQSHMFLNKEEPTSNFVVSHHDGQVFVSRIEDGNGVVDATYRLLGNSLEDLFFPSNFLIVEGGSDQEICERVCSLLGIPQERVKTISAKGIDNVKNVYTAIQHILTPLVASPSPYAKRIVVLLDKPSKEAEARVEAIKQHLQDRLYVLDSHSIEEYLPDEIYKRLGKTKKDVLDGIKLLKDRSDRAESIKELSIIKKNLSKEIAEILTKDDLQKIPIITDAVKHAIKNTQ